MLIEKIDSNLNYLQMCFLADYQTSAYIFQNAFFHLAHMAHPTPNCTETGHVYGRRPIVSQEKP